MSDTKNLDKSKLEDMSDEDLYRLKEKLRKNLPRYSIFSPYRGPNIRSIPEIDDDIDLILNTRRYKRKAEELRAQAEAKEARAAWEEQTNNCLKATNRRSAMMDGTE